MKISLILPIYNEQAILGEVLEKYISELRSITKAIPGSSYEIVAVNDGCTDASPEILMKEAKLNRSLRIVNLTQRFGKEAAVTAGFETVSGDVTILADVTLLNPLGIIERVVGEYQSGHPIVYAYREGIGWENTKHSFSHSLIRMAAKVFSIPGEYTGRAHIMLYSKEVTDILKKLPHKNKFMRTMDNWTGYEIHTIGYTSSYSKDEVQRKTRVASNKMRRDGYHPPHRSRAREHTPSIVYSITSFILALMFLGGWIALEIFFGIDIWWHVVAFITFAVIIMCGVLFYARAIMIKRIGTVHHRDDEILYEVENVVN